jgi:competence protein ComFC
MYTIINESKALNVKNTMIDKVLSFIAPHPCCGCGKLQGLLCANCKYDIVNDVFIGCIGCGGVSGVNGVCRRCIVPYSRAWCAGERSGALQELIDRYKFERVREVHKVAADLLAAILPDLPDNVVIVPVPTISAHIRERGYDHTLLVARSLGRQLHLPVARPLVRATQTKQREASRSVRTAQAKQAFMAKDIDKTACYLLLDDVVTTGATIKYAAKALKQAGAKDVWIAAIARQPLH